MVEWYTRSTQNALPHGLGVQVPLRALDDIRIAETGVSNSECGMVGAIAFEGLTQHRPTKIDICGGSSTTRAFYFGKKVVGANPASRAKLCGVVQG
jgi:hypothetical protein